MPWRPPEGEFKPDYHNFNDGDAKQWVIDGKQPVRVTILPGPADSWSTEGIERRVKEYETFLLRMRDRRRQTLETEIQEQALKRHDEKRAAIADREIEQALVFIPNRPGLEYEACLKNALLHGVAQATFKRAWEMKERTHETIAENLRTDFPTAPEFGITISREYVTRAINAGWGDLRKHVSGNSTSVLIYERKPPL